MSGFLGFTMYLSWFQQPNFCPKNTRKFQRIFVTTDLLLNVSHITLQMIHTLNCLFPFMHYPACSSAKKTMFLKTPYK